MMLWEQQARGAERIAQKRGRAWRTFFASLGLNANGWASVKIGVAIYHCNLVCSAKPRNDLT